jgi:argininosuccinate lyase
VRFRPCIGAIALALAFAFAVQAVPAVAQEAMPRDEFFWLGEMNKATAVINTDQGPLPASLQSSAPATSPARSGLPP